MTYLRVVDVDDTLLPHSLSSHLDKVDAVLDESLHGVEEEREALEGEQQQHRGAGVLEHKDAEHEPTNVRHQHDQQQ